MAIARFLDIMCLALRASGLWLRYAALQNLIPSFPWIAPHALHPGAIRGKEGIKFCHLATLVAGSDRGLPGIRPALDGVCGGRIIVVVGGNVHQSADFTPVERQADRARLLHQLPQGGRPLGQGE